MPHFIRGYIDGDGAISFKKDGNLLVGILSSTTFASGLQNYLKTWGIQCGIYTCCSKIKPLELQKRTYSQDSGWVIKARMKTLELIAKISLDEIRYQLSEQLTTKQLIAFVLELSDDLIGGPEFLNGLKKELDGLKVSAMGNIIHNTVIKTIKKEKRPGGLLSKK